MDTSRLKAFLYGPVMSCCPRQEGSAHLDISFSTSEVLQEVPGLTTRSKKLLVTKGIATRDKKLLGAPGIATNGAIGRYERGFCPEAKRAVVTEAGAISRRAA